MSPLGQLPWQGALTSSGIFVDGVREELSEDSCAKLVPAVIDQGVEREEKQSAKVQHL